MAVFVLLTGGLYVPFWYYLRKDGMNSQPSRTKAGWAFGGAYVFSILTPVLIGGAVGIGLAAAAAGPASGNGLLTTLPFLLLSPFVIVPMVAFMWFGAVVHAVYPMVYWKILADTFPDDYVSPYLACLFGCFYLQYKMNRLNPAD